MLRPQSTRRGERAATRHLTAAVLVLTLPVLCAAQAPPPAPELQPDRPGFGESSGVVGPGTIQIESGLTIEQSDPALRQITAPEVLARVGLTTGLELRLSADGLIDQSVRTPTRRVHADGGSDTVVGAKVKLLDAARARVDLAVIAYLSLPTASAGFGSDHYDPGVKVVAGRELPHGVGASGTFNAADARGDTGRGWQREGSVSLDHRVHGSVAAFGEVDGSFAGHRCDCSVDGGLTVAVGVNRQFDVEAGRGVHGAAQDWFVGAGFVIRAPIRARRR